MLPAGRPATRQDLILAALVCGGFGLYGWGLFLASFKHDGALGPHFNAPGADWTVVLASYPVGFMHEPKGRAQMAHLAEHLSPRHSLGQPFREFVEPIFHHVLLCLSYRFKKRRCLRRW